MEEESLWRSRQLGEHSPTSLLLSLVYLNTKHLGLRSLDEHLRLSFTDVYGPDGQHPVTKETAVCVRVPSLPQELPGEFWRSSYWLCGLTHLCCGPMIILHVAVHILILCDWTLLGI